MGIISKEFRQIGVMLFIGSLLLVKPVYATEVHSQSGNFSGNSTPTQYTITVSRIEFHKVGDPADTFITYVNQSADWDIASVGAGSSIGTMTASGTLSAGTYDKIRFTVSKTMTIKGSIASLSDSSPCRTESVPTTVSNPFGDGSLNIAYLGERDGGAAEPETVTVPSGSNVDPSPDFTDLGTSFRGTIPVTFTVTDKAPNIKLKFDVTNSLQFVLRPNTNQCMVFPGPPSLSIEVT